MSDSPAEKVKKAWHDFNGVLEHSLHCGPKNVYMRLEAVGPCDPRCTCGLKELYQTLNELTYYRD